MFKLVLIPGLCALAAFAQTTQIKIADEKSGAFSITALVTGPAPAIPGLPYSAKAVTERVQTLSDGNHITHTTTNMVARDGSGRVYRQESIPGYNNNEIEPAARMAFIEDPVAGELVTLDNASKIATRVKVTPDAKKRADEAAFKAGPGSQLTLQIVSDGSSSEHPKTTDSDLGTQIIEGVMAKGTKMTRTIPAGEVGNDAPLVITTETWFSPDLKVLVMSKSSDPRIGETTYKLTNISRAEPDSALFHIPGDFTIRDQPANSPFVIRDMK